MNKKEHFDQIWNPSVNRIGRSTIFAVAALSFLPTTYLYLVHGLIPPLEVMLNTWLLVAMVFGAFYVVEPMSYYPILGLAGTYISFLSGNIGNMRVPCSAIAQEVVGVKPETPEAEIISTLGLTGSVITNLIAVSLAAIVGAQLLGLLPASITYAFHHYAVPAIFGAVFGQFAMQSPRLAVFAIGIPLGLYFLAGQPGLAFLGRPWLIILVAIFGTVGIARFFYNQEKKQA